MDETLGDRGLYTYDSYGAEGAPSTFMSYIGFGWPLHGQAEIGVEWTGAAGLWYRSQGDWQNWTGWKQVIDSGNIGSQRVAYAAAADTAVTATSVTNVSAQQVKAALGTNASATSVYLRGDGAWATPPTSGGGGSTGAFTFSNGPQATMGVVSSSSMTIDASGTGGLRFVTPNPTYAPNWIQSGSCKANANSVTEVKFPTAFTQTPNVVASYCTTGGNVTGAWGQLKISSLTTSGFKITCAGSLPATDVDVRWVAVNASNA